MSTPLTDAELAAIEARAKADWLGSDYDADAALSMVDDDDGDPADDVRALVAEVRRLRAPTYTIEMTAPCPDCGGKVVGKVMGANGAAVEALSARASLDNALAVLAQVEWAAKTGIEDDFRACPCCHGQKTPADYVPDDEDIADPVYGHRPDCALARVLAGAK